MVDRDELKKEREKRIKELFKQAQSIAINAARGKISLIGMVAQIHHLHVEIRHLLLSPIPPTSFEPGRNLLVGESNNEFIMPTKGSTVVTVSKKDTDEIVKGLKASDFEVTTDVLRTIQNWSADGYYFAGHKCIYKGLEYELIGSMKDDAFDPYSVNDQPDISECWKLKE